MLRCQAGSFTAASLTDTRLSAQPRTCHFGVLLQRCSAEPRPSSWSSAASGKDQKRQLPMVSDHKLEGRRHPCISSSSSWWWLAFLRSLCCGEPMIQPLPGSSISSFSFASDLCSDNAMAAQSCAAVRDACRQDLQLRSPQTAWPLPWPPSLHRLRSDSAGWTRS